MSKKKDQKFAKKISKAPSIDASFEVSEEKKEIKIPSVITVKELAEKTGIPVASLISELMKSGILAAINESVDFETAAIVCDDLGISCLPEAETSENSQGDIIKNTEADKKLSNRPPVVTVMGHVDHGKTSLLDKIRLANVADSESGGITQHISAYQVLLSGTKNKNLKDKLITFIDTPGHAAFSALRSHGAAITDIVILIVAADDGVMPQTIEVIEQCQKHHVPMIVAINKVDLPDADINKVKQQLADHGLIPEDWGGKTVMIPVSAKTSEGIDNLLEVVALQADMMELKADYDQKAFGVVIESHMHKGAGPLALILVENGTLRLGDAVQIGHTWGKVRIMEDFNRKPIKTALPSTPVRIAGLKDLPHFGEHLIAFANEKEAKLAAGSSSARTSLKIATAKKISEDDKSRDDDLELKIIIKADVRGSLEAIKKLILDIDTLELSIKIIGEGVGAVSESDVTLAATTKAIVYAFRVPLLASAEKISRKDKVDIESYQVIYELINNIKDKLTLKLAPEISDEVVGRGKVLEIFRDDKKAIVIGARLDEGDAKVGNLVKFFKDKEVVADTKIISLRREKSEVSEVGSGIEFGMSLDPGNKLVKDEKLEVYFKKITARKIK